MYACEQCDKKFKFDSERKRHEVSHDPQFSCSECLKKFSFVSSLKRHQKQHRRIGPVECTACNRSFKDDTLLERHIKYAHNGTHICSECKAKFNSQQALLSHQKIHTPKSKRRYRCRHNGCEKTFNFVHHLKHHELAHNSDKQHFCSICGKGFIQLHHLKTHIKEHKPNCWLNCKIPGCFKIFTNDYALKRHLATHDHLIKTEHGILDMKEISQSYNSNSPDSLEAEHNDLEQIHTEDDKETHKTLKQYKLLGDLSSKKNTEKFDNLQNLVSYELNNNTCENMNKSKLKTVDSCGGCDCANKNENSRKEIPELVYKNDGTIKIKEFIGSDISLPKEEKKESIMKMVFNVPYNSCKAVLGTCIVSGTGTINENCLCAKMAIDDSPMTYHEINELTPIPYQA